MLLRPFCKAIVPVSLLLSACVTGTDSDPQDAQDAVESTDFAWTKSKGWTRVKTPVMSGTSLLEFDARVTRNVVDAVVGTSLGPADAYTKLAAIVRFGPDGIIDVRDQGAYVADAKIAYESGKRYHIAISSDYAKKSYQVTVTPEGGSPVRLKSSARFRSEQNNVDRSDHVSFFEKSDQLEVERITIDGVAIGSTTTPAATPMPSNGLWSVDFESSPLGDYSDADIRKEWKYVKWTQTYGRVAVMEENGNRFIRVNYPKGGVGHGKGGALWATGLGKSYGEFFVSYRLRFKPGFNFVLGGKLHGLFGGAGNTGGDKPTGSDGWSARMMWRKSGGAVQYFYNPDQTGSWGEDLNWNKTFPTGEWITVESRVVVNTPGQRNGIVQGWYNGKLVLDKRNARMRDVSSFGVDGFYFSTFFGGNTQDWAPTRDETIDFDSFVFSDKPITH